MIGRDLLSVAEFNALARAIGEKDFIGLSSCGA